MIAPPPPRTSRSPTSAPPCATRSASRSPASRSRHSCRAAAARRSWSSRRRCPIPDPRAIRGRRRSSRRRTSSSGSACRPTVRRSSSRAASRAGRAGGWSRASSRRSSRSASAASVVVHDAEDPRSGRPRVVRRRPAASGPQRSSRPTRSSPSERPRPCCTAGRPRCSRRPVRETVRAAAAESLLETHSAPGWELALALERALARRTRLIGASLTLDLPRLTGALRGYPYERAAVERIAALTARTRLRLVPGALRMRALTSLPARAHGVGGVRRPAVGRPRRGAPARRSRPEAPRSTSRSTRSCIGIPRTTLALPRERPNALAAAALGLGYALRLWRDAFPVREGGTAILAHAVPAPLRPPDAAAVPRASSRRPRTGRDPATLAEAERAAAADPRAIDAYRAGRTCHPLPPVRRLGRLPPPRSTGSARSSSPAAATRPPPASSASSRRTASRRRSRWPAASAARTAAIGFLLSPPYFPVRVERLARGYCSPR